MNYYLKTPRNNPYITERDGYNKQLNVSYKNACPQSMTAVIGASKVNLF